MPGLFEKKIGLFQQKLSFNGQFKHLFTAKLTGSPQIPLIPEQTINFKIDKTIVMFFATTLDTFKSKA